MHLARWHARCYNALHPEAGVQRRRSHLQDVFAICGRRSATTQSPGQPGGHRRGLPPVPPEPDELARAAAPPSRSTARRTAAMPSGSADPGGLIRWRAGAGMLSALRPAGMPFVPSTATRPTFISIFLAPEISLARRAQMSRPLDEMDGLSLLVPDRPRDAAPRPGAGRDDAPAAGEIRPAGGRAAGDPRSPSASRACWPGNPARQPKG